MFVGHPQKGGFTLVSNIIRFTVWSRIHMEVSPMEYPVQGESWTVFVYSVNITSQGVFLTPSLNSTVVISVKDNGNGITYQLPGCKGSGDIFSIRALIQMLRFRLLRAMSKVKK